jgi:hypothetical protein
MGSESLEIPSDPLMIRVETLGEPPGQDSNLRPSPTKVLLYPTELPGVVTSLLQEVGAFYFQVLPPAGNAVP